MMIRVLAIILLMFLVGCAEFRELNGGLPRNVDSSLFEEWDLQRRTEHSPRTVVFQYKNQALDALYVVRVDGKVELQVFALRDFTYCVKYPGQECQITRPHLARLLLTPESILLLEQTQ